MPNEKFVYLISQLSLGARQPEWEYPDVLQSIAPAMANCAAFYYLWLQALPQFKQIALAIQALSANHQLSRTQAVARLQGDLSELAHCPDDYLLTSWLCLVRRYHLFTKMDNLATCVRAWSHWNTTTFDFCNAYFALSLPEEIVNGFALSLTKGFSYENVVREHSLEILKFIVTNHVSVQLQNLAKATRIDFFKMWDLLLEVSQGKTQINPASLDYFASLKSKNPPGDTRGYLAKHKLQVYFAQAPLPESTSQVASLWQERENMFQATLSYLASIVSDPMPVQLQKKLLIFMRHLSRGLIHHDLAALLTHITSLDNASANYARAKAIARLQHVVAGCIKEGVRFNSMVREVTDEWQKFIALDVKLKQFAAIEQSYEGPRSITWLQNRLLQAYLEYAENTPVAKVLASFFSAVIMQRNGIQAQHKQRGALSWLGYFQPHSRLVTVLDKQLAYPVAPQPKFKII